MAATRAEIAGLFRVGRPEDVEDFIRTCPEFPFREQALVLAVSAAPASRSLALSTVSLGLTSGRAATLGAEVALAAHDLLREDFDRLGPAVILPVTLSRTAYEAINALNLAGRYEEAIAFADQVIPAYDAEPSQGPSIRVGKISALYSLDRIDDARGLIDVELKRGITGPATIDLHRLATAIGQRTTDVRALKREQPATEASEDLALENKEHRGLADLMLKLIAGSGRELNEATVTKLIRDGTSIFTHPLRGKDPTLIRESLAMLTRAREWARAARSSDENDALWGIYLCHNRLGEPVACVEALSALRANIERARARIASPFERGGISSQFPWLFNSLCFSLVGANRPLDLLHAIEGAKGRAIADLLVKRAHQPIDERTLTDPVSRLPDLVRAAGVHYISYFVDTDATYAVLVAKDGSVHQAGSIALGREMIRQAAQRVDPNLAARPGEPAVDLLLAPLLSWLEPHRRSGLVQGGDHICYSPDEHLHQIPLHFVRFNGVPLVEGFSVSRTHGARALAMQLERSATKPGEFLAIEVPTAQNAQSPEFLEQLGRVRIWLEKHSRGKALRNEMARPEALKHEKLSNRVVHFATHGRFPEVGGCMPPNPYEGSGLLLASRDGLPDGDRVARGELEEAMLSPKGILDLGFDFSGSHVTLQACVSGLASEGVGGDALGLDWAFMQAGASSLLASHWNVRAGASAAFFERFYEHWLRAGLSRAKAWWTTINELRSVRGPLATASSWAAFSLSGDWR